MFVPTRDYNSSSHILCEININNPFVFKFYNLSITHHVSHSFWTDVASLIIPRNYIAIGIQVTTQRVGDTHVPMWISGRWVHNSYCIAVRVDSAWHLDIETTSVI